MKVNKSKIVFGMILLLGIFLISFGSSIYQNYNPQSQPFTSSSLGGSFGGAGMGSSFYGQENYEEYCRSGTDFIFQIEPFSCTPTPVRSDLLEEQNVPVFCKIRGMKMNPLMDVKAIERISFSGRDYPKEVAGVNFYPAKAALGGKPSMDNVGYLVIFLRQQPNESAMPDYVSGNLTTRVRYDIGNAFGIGKANFYLPEMNDEDWENNQLQYSFWGGRGYLRAENIDDSGARITVYSDRYSKGLRGQNLDKIKVDSFYLNPGEESSRIYLPGFNPCMANLRLKLDSLENPDTRARLRINDDIIQIKDGGEFLEGKCSVRRLEKYGLLESVEIDCDEDDEGFLSNDVFELTVSPKIDLKIGGKISTYEIGDKLYREGGKTVYLGYIGTKGDKNSLDDLFVYVVALPEDNPRLTPEEIKSFTSEADRLSPTDNSGAFGSIGKIIEKAGGSVLRAGNFIVKGEQLEMIPSGETKNFLGTDIFISDFGGIGDFEFGGSNDFKRNYEKAIEDFDVVLNSFAGETVDGETAGEEALRKKIELSSKTKQKKSLKEFCLEFEERYPSASVPGECGQDLFFSNSGITSKNVLINGKTRSITFDGIYEPSERDYSAVLYIRTPEGEIKEVILTKNNPVKLERTADVSLISIREKLDFDWPVDKTTFDRISSCYGCRYLSIHTGEGDEQCEDSPGLNDFTDGIDIAIPEGTDVKSVADGDVESICNKCENSNNNCDKNNRMCNGYGNYVIVDHKNGYYTKYSHLRDVEVKVGDILEKGEVLGKSGNTGASEGPHLDFKVFEGKDFSSDIGKNPICFLSNPGEKTKFTGTGCEGESYNENIKAKICEKYTKPSIVPNTEQVTEDTSYEIELVDLETNSARIYISGEGNERLKKEVKETVEIDGKDYDFTLKEINLNKVAQVSIDSNMDYMQSEANFSFKIGIEKRAIQLSPERTKEKINNLNNSIKTLTDISEGLGDFLQTMKATCLAGGSLILAKNFLEKDSGLKSTARQRIMSEKWNGKCIDMVNQGEYATQEECFMDNADEIDEDVNEYYKLLKEQNEGIKDIQSKYEESKFFGETYVNTEEFVGEYSEKIKEDLDYLGDKFTNPLESGKFVDINKVKDVLDKEGFKKGIYSMTELRDIEFYLKAYKTDNNDENAEKKLYSLLKGIEINSQSYRAGEMFSEETGLGENTVVLFDEKSKEIKVSQHKTIQESKYSRPKGINPNLYVYGIKKGNEEFVVFYDRDGAVTSTYRISGNVLQKTEESNPLNVHFEEYNEQFYENKIKEPQVKYYESEPYKGLPGLVPVDVDKGWYVYAERTLPSGVSRSYDESGRINSFWLCNVGSNGLVEFNTRNVGDDECQLVNLGTGQPVNQFPGLSEGDSTKLVSKAVNNIEMASRQYDDGLRSLVLGGKQIDVGSPMIETSGTKCTDFMSPKDCNTIFNLCDPVICPPSRCDLGGKYPVKNVVQTGIVGSIALCLPNWNEGIYIPVCLTGVKAGIDGWLSVKKSYRDCLQESLDTGRTIGICDRLHSVYLCELFWREAKAITNTILPNLISRVSGETKTHGGAEYLNIQNAWQTTKGAWNFLTKNYGETAYKAFQLRKTGEVGSAVCKNFGSIVFPKSADVLDAATQPDSPTQFHGSFEEIPYTSVTNPPQSHYKVTYHIYAGQDRGAYYRVYLKASEGSSFYPDTSRQRIVGTGYVNRGSQETQTEDFIAPSGYKELCIVVNGQEECGFEQVSTSFTPNYIKDKYLEQQATDVTVTSRKQCIQGTASAYDFLMSGGNVQETASEAMNPELQNKGMIRVCSTSNPGRGSDSSYGTESARWKEVGYCDSKDVKCWIDTESVEDTIRHQGIEEKTLKEVTENQLALLAERGDILSEGEYKQTLEKIRNLVDSEEREQAIKNITQIIGRVPWNSEKARLYLMRGELYGELTKIYFDRLWDEIEIEKLRQEVIGRDSTRGRILSSLLQLEGQACIKINELNEEEKNELKTSGEIKTWKSVDVVEDYDEDEGCNCFDSVMYFYRKSGVEFDGFKNCLNDDILKDYDNDGCENTEDINKDMLEKGDILSLGWKYESGENTAHNVIFLEWIDKEKGEARLFDWIGEYEDWEIERDYPDNSEEIKTKEVKKLRIFSMNLNFDEEDVLGVVYAVGKPKIEVSREEAKASSERVSMEEETGLENGVSPVFTINTGSENMLVPWEIVYYDSEWHYEFKTISKFDDYRKYWMPSSYSNKEILKNTRIQKIVSIVEDSSYKEGLKNLIINIDDSNNQIHSLVTDKISYNLEGKEIFLVEGKEDKVYLKFLDTQKGYPNWYWIPEKEVELDYTGWRGSRKNVFEFDSDDKYFIPVSQNKVPEEDYYPREVVGEEIIGDDLNNLIEDLDKIGGESASEWDTGVLRIFQESNVDEEIMNKQMFPEVNPENEKLENLDVIISYLSKICKESYEGDEELRSYRDFEDFTNFLVMNNVLGLEESDFLGKWSGKSRSIFCEYIKKYLEFKKKIITDYGGHFDISKAIQKTERLIEDHPDKYCHDLENGGEYSDCFQNEILVDYLYVHEIIGEDLYKQVSGKGLFRGEKDLKYLLEGEENIKGLKDLASGGQTELFKLNVNVPEGYKNLAKELNQKEITFLNGKHYPYSNSQKSDEYVSNYFEFKDKLDNCDDEDEKKELGCIINLIKTEGAGERTKTYSNLNNNFIIDALYLNDYLSYDEYGTIVSEDKTLDYAQNLIVNEFNSL